MSVLSEQAVYTCTAFTCAVSHLLITQQLSLHNFKKNQEKLSMEFQFITTVVTFHVGHTSVTCHPTHGNTARLNFSQRPLLDLPTLKRCKIELTMWLAAYRNVCTLQSKPSK